MKLLQSYSKKQFYRNEVAICLYSVIIYMGPPYVRIHVHGYRCVPIQLQGVPTYIRESENALDFVNSNETVHN